MLMALHEQKQVQYKQMRLVGFNVGAQIAGVAGTLLFKRTVVYDNIKKHQSWQVGRIYGKSLLAYANLKLKIDPLQP